MTCPVCGARTLVKDSRSECDVVLRKRQCTFCAYVFYTSETEAKDSRDDLSNCHKKLRLKKKEEIKQ